MKNYLNVLASVQTSLQKTAEKLSKLGHTDLSGLISLCAERLNDTDLSDVKNWIDIIHKEAEDREEKSRMELCPKCKVVKKPKEKCSQCGHLEVSVK